jgi:NADP-dependent 3-hydroxy acid dehydrogenase YdfG
MHTVPSLLRLHTLQVVALAGDITSAEAPGTMVGALKSEFGRIDVLVNNAGECLCDSVHTASCHS